MSDFYTALEAIRQEVSPSAYARAKELIMRWSLHSDFPLPHPEPIPGPDGQISLKWYRPIHDGLGGQALYVEPTVDTLHYAFFDPETGEKDYGWVAWDDSAKLNHVRQLTKVFLSK